MPCAGERRRRRPKNGDATRVGGVEDAHVP
jgi:hypothetical protein